MTRSRTASPAPAPARLRRRRRARRAFTLIEVVAAVLIMALLATLAGVSLRGGYGRASFEDVAQQLIRYDAGARAVARQLGAPVRLKVSPHKVAQQPLHENRGDAPTRPALRLAEGYQLTADPGNGGDNVTISADGRSRTYALRLRGPDGQEQWIVFAGLTGQASFFDDEANVQDILTALAASRLPAGPDAD